MTTDPQEQFENTLKHMMETAMTDGKVTPEELDIIRQVEIDADSYTLMLHEALRDGKITIDEQERLDELKALIKERAETIAGVDGVVTDDEKALLTKLFDLLKTYQ